MCRFCKTPLKTSGLKYTCSSTYVYLCVCLFTKSLCTAVFIVFILPYWCILTCLSSSITFMFIDAVLLWPEQCHLIQLCIFDAVHEWQWQCAFLGYFIFILQNFLYYFCLTVLFDKPKMKASFLNEWFYKSSIINPQVEFFTLKKNKVRAATTSGLFKTKQK